MASGEFRIVFDEHGYPRELLSPAERRRAVLSGSLTADTLVTVYRTGVAPIAARADDVAELHRLFLSVSNAPQVDSAPHEIERVAEGGMRSSGESVAPKASYPQDTGRQANTSDALDARELSARQVTLISEEQTADEWPASDEGDTHFGRGQGYRPALWPKLLALAAIAGCLLLSWVWISLSTPSVMNTVSVQTFIVARTSNVRLSPSSANAPVMGQLRAGDTVSGTIRPENENGYPWLEISGGPNSGRFVWMGNLGPANAPNGELEVANMPPGPIAPTDCRGPQCHVVTPDGWAGIRAGMTVEAAMKAAGFQLKKPGHYDEVFADEPGRVDSCNVYNIQGVTENVSVFVEKGIITSVGVDGDDSRFETERGVGLGDPEAKVRNAYDPLTEEPDIYSEPPDKKLFYKAPNGNGIKFSILKGKVAAIDVGGGSIHYVEGCL